MDNHEVMLAVLLGPANVGDRFSQWPLHLTLLPWFEVADIDAAAAKLTVFIGSHKTFSVAVGESGHLGQHNDLLVDFIQPDVSLEHLHRDVREFINNQGWHLRGRYVGDQYKPHVTQKGRLHASDDIMVDTLYLVEALPQNYAHITHRFDLGA